MPAVRKKRPAFLDSKTNNRADTLIRDFNKGNRVLAHPSISNDIRQLMLFRDGIRQINKRGERRTAADREKVKNLESHIRRILSDISAKRAELRGQNVFESGPE